MNKIRLILYKLGLLRHRKISTSYTYINEFDYGYPCGTPKDLDYYYDDKNVNSFNNGFQIVARKSNNPNFKYSSGALWSKKQFFRGSFEAEIFIPKGIGLWNSFWLYSQDSERFTEIDILEWYGTVSKFTYNTHYGTDYNHNLSPGADSIELKKLENSWHKYRLDWEEKKLKIYIDDKLVGIRDGRPFKYPMNIIINMAMEKRTDNELDKVIPTIMTIKNIKYYENK